MAKGNSITPEIRKQITTEMEEKWSEIFVNQAQYVGNGIYKISNLHSTDTRELFLMFIAMMELDIEFN